MGKTRDKRLWAALLCLCLIPGLLSGCGSSLADALREGAGDIRQAVRAPWASPGESEGDAPPPEDSPAPTPPPEDFRVTDFFADAWHADVGYADMAYEHYDYSDFEAYVGAIRDFAGRGGTAYDFARADDAAVNELYYIYTLYCLMDIQYSQEQTDDASDEILYITEVYDEASDDYWDAMHALAVSPYAGLLSDAYEDWQIAWFEDYDAEASGADWDLYSRETELVQDYYGLIAASNPDYGEICSVYVELVEVRREIAEQNGYGGYAGYAYENLYCKGYEPSDAEALWALAKEYFAPLVSEYADRVYDRSSRLYWSDEIDCSPEAILSAMGEVLPQISSELSEAFDYMLKHGLYDIGDSAHKLNTGYTTCLYYYNEPFILNCPTGTYYDYTDMFHEFGHFTNMFYTESDLIFGVSDNDLCELQSQGLEVLSMHFYGEIFGEDNSEPIKNEMLLSLLYSIVDGCLYDEFQQRVFEEKDLDEDAVLDIYRELYEDYGYEPYSGYEYEWADIQHNFEFPFYYISYAVSAISALELYAMARDDFEGAADVYLSVAALDTEDWYFSDALDEVGLGDVFDAAACKAVADAVEASFK